MTFRVIWSPAAEEALERLLSIAVDREAMAASARQIDRRLMTAAGNFGESRYDAMRIGFVFPLGVQFEVMDDVRTAIVHGVWSIER